VETITPKRKRRNKAEQQWPALRCAQRSERKRLACQRAITTERKTEPAGQRSRKRSKDDRTKPSEYDAAKWKKEQERLDEAKCERLLRPTTETKRFVTTNA
jgi:hypothetical protein